MKKDYLERQSYPTDLTDSQWTVIAPLFVNMREYKYSKRELMNALLYLVDSGCKWSTQLLQTSTTQRTLGQNS